MIYSYITLILPYKHNTERLGFNFPVDQSKIQHK